MKIASLLATKGNVVHSITPDKTIREVIKQLSEHNIGSLIVLDSTETPIGIITERDVIRRAAVSEQLFDEKVGDIMTTNVITCVPQDELVAAANTMTENRFRHLPILEGDRLIGMISIGDIVKAQRDEYEGEITTLQSQMGNAE